VEVAAARWMREEGGEISWKCRGRESVMGVGGATDPRGGKSRFNFDFWVRTRRRESSLEVACPAFHIPLYARLPLHIIRYDTTRKLQIY
jgi:hypothetical protein